MSRRSAPVRTQTTPGTRSAKEVSIETMRPCAIGLQGRVTGERLVELRELRSLREPLDRRHRGAGRLRREVAARADGETVDEDGACSADLDVARTLRAGEVQ